METAAIRSQNPDSAEALALAEQAAADRVAAREAENASEDKALSAQDFFYEQAGDR